MSKRDTEFLTAQTRRLEALGIILGNWDAVEMSETEEPTSSGGNKYQPPLHPHPRRGRKRVYQSAALKQRAYRDRSRSRVLRNRLATIDS
jgi:hypothetical protein